MSTTASGLGARPTKSAGAAALGVVVSLAVFVVTFIAFLIAPLLVLLIGYLVYVAMKPRERGGEAAPAEESEDGTVHERHEHGTTAFGSGAS